MFINCDDDYAFAEPVDEVSTSWVRTRCIPYDYSNAYRIVDAQIHTRTHARTQAQMACLIVL